MDRNIDITKHQTLSTGTLKKTGGQYQLVLLTAEDIPQILELQDVAFKALTKEQQDFLHHKTPEFFKKHFENGNPILGIVHDGKLVAQGIILNPTIGNADNGMSDMKIDALPNKVTVMQGVIVDPEYRGNNLMTFMVDEWLSLAKEQKRTHALAEVTVENHHSWAVFMKEGLHIHSIGHDDSDGSDVYNMHASVTHLIKQRARPDFNKAARKSAICHMDQLLPQKALLRKGYIGVSFDAKSKTIAFRAPRQKRCSHGKQVL